MNESVITLLDKLPFKPNLTTQLSASSGKQSTVYNVCAMNLKDLQDLMKRANVAYDVFTNSANVMLAINADISESSPETGNYTRTRIEAGITVAGRMFSEIQKVLDPTKIEYIKMVYAVGTSSDFATINPAFRKFEAELLEIQKIAAKIKKENQPTSTTIKVTDKLEGSNDIDNIVLSKIVYDIDLYMILPGGEKVSVEQYVHELLYQRNFEGSALPIYSVLFKIPQNIMFKFKEHFENIKWYITVRCRERRLSIENDQFSFPETVVDNAQLIAIDPVYGQAEEVSGSVEGAIPVTSTKIDFVPYKDTKLNATVQSRVFNNIRMLDVLTILCAELRAEYGKSNPDTKNIVKFTISPPDNTQVYEQILIEPGSFTDVIYQLQTKYGIYMTGVRVSFDSVQSLKQKGSQKIVNETHITILDKGGTAPTQSSITDVLIELINPKYTKTPLYDSGFNINKDNNTIILRSYLPYIVNRKNSEVLSKGESVRVMQNSTTDHTISNCDSAISDTNMEKLYWSNYDNPFALTQMQDSIREQGIEINAEIRDINIFAYNDNLKYNVKFYSQDDDLYSGEYRLRAMRFFMRNNSSTPMRGVEVSGIYAFTNMPPLRVNGSVVDRQSYGEKIASGASVANGGNGYSRLEGGGLQANVAVSADGTSKSPYKTNFQGKQDLYGIVIPVAIPDSFKMSETVTFKDMYMCKDGTDVKKAIGLATNFTYFINAQRYCKEVLDPLNSMFSRLGVGKLNSFYRYGIPGGGSKTSQHLVAMASDALWGGSPGDALAEAFFKIMNSDIEFDQIILEGNGSQWRWIHVGKQMNGTNRKELKLAPNALAGNYKTINKNKLLSPDDLSWANWRKVVY